jgi:hypothetical protein
VKFEGGLVNIPQRSKEMNRKNFEKTSKSTANGGKSGCTVCIPRDVGMRLVKGIHNCNCYNKMII